MNTLNFKLQGLTCEACVKLASRRLAKVPGVQTVKIDLNSGQTEVSVTDKVELMDLDKSLLGSEYSILK